MGKIPHKERDAAAPAAAGMRKKDIFLLRVFLLHFPLVDKRRQKSHGGYIRVHSQRTQREREKKKEINK